MTMVLEEYINSLSEEELLQCIKEAEEFRREGSIGDCLLREHTRKFVTQLLGKIDVWVGLASWMDRFTYECYRRIALETIKANTGWAPEGWRTES